MFQNISKLSEFDLNTFAKTATSTTRKPTDALISCFTALDRAAIIGAPSSVLCTTRITKESNYLFEGQPYYGNDISTELKSNLVGSHQHPLAQQAFLITPELIANAVRVKQPTPSLFDLRALNTTAKKPSLIELFMMSSAIALRTGQYEPFTCLISPDVSDSWAHPRGNPRHYFERAINNVKARGRTICVGNKSYKRCLEGIGLDILFAVEPPQETGAVGTRGYWHLHGFVRIPDQIKGKTNLDARKRFISALLRRICGYMSKKSNQFKFSERDRYRLCHDKKSREQLNYASYALKEISLTSRKYSINEDQLIFIPGALKKLARQSWRRFAALYARCHEDIESYVKRAKRYRALAGKVAYCALMDDDAFELEVWQDVNRRGKELTAGELRKKINQRVARKRFNVLQALFRKYGDDFDTASSWVARMERHHRHWKATLETVTPGDRLFLDTPEPSPTGIRAGVARHRVTP